MSRKTIKRLILAALFGTLIGVVMQNAAIGTAMGVVFFFGSIEEARRRAARGETSTPRPRRQRRRDA